MHVLHAIVRGVGVAVLCALPLGAVVSQTGGPRATAPPPVAAPVEPPPPPALSVRVAPPHLQVSGAQRVFQTEVVSRYEPGYDPAAAPRIASVATCAERLCQWTALDTYTVSARGSR